MNRLVASIGLLTLFALTIWGFSASDPIGPPPAPAPTDVYNPVAAGERLPDGFRQVLPRDAIAPIYEPRFVDADQSGWDDSVQVIGVELEDEAKAYPVSLLNRREMVNDFLAGDPILVTW